MVAFVLLPGAAPGFARQHCVLRHSAFRPTVAAPTWSTPSRTRTRPLTAAPLPLRPLVAAPAVDRGAKAVTTTTTTTTMMTTAGKDPPGRAKTAKELAARYGGAYLVTSIALSLVSFAAFYALISVGVDVRGGIIALGNWLATTPLGRPAVLDNVSDVGGTFALAYVAHKATSPLRFPPTIVATEFVARFLGKNKEAPEGKAADDSELGREN